MLVPLFTWLNNTLTASPWIALCGAFIWGVLSILLSPCHLAGIPLIIGFIDGQGRISTRRAFGLSLLFSAGILLMIAFLGMLTSLLGRMAGDLGPWGRYLVAGVFLAVGAHLLGILPLPGLSQAGNLRFAKKGWAAAFLLGLIFGVALGPCTFAFMAPVLGAAFSLATAHFGVAAFLVAAYALGHVSVIVLAGTFAEGVQRYLNWNEKSEGALILRKICGGLVVLAGVYMLVQ